MIFTNANDTTKSEESMLSYYNYTSKVKFIDYKSPQINKNDNYSSFKNNNYSLFKNKKQYLKK